MSAFDLVSPGPFMCLLANKLVHPRLVNNGVNHSAQHLYWSAAVHLVAIIFSTALFGQL